MIPRAALAYIKWILPLINEPVSTINISCAALTKEIPSVLQTQNKTDVHLPNLAYIASLSGALLHSPFSPSVSISFYTFNMPKNSKTVRKNPKKYPQKYLHPSPAKIPQKNSTNPEITHTKNENKKMFKRKKGASK